MKSYDSDFRPDKKPTGEEVNSLLKFWFGMIRECISEAENVVNEEAVKTRNLIKAFIVIEVISIICKVAYALGRKTE